ncbi:hypothetical protein [Nostoc sp. MS1]|uniref:hypothetical protein n=1 Tax=Nostoc sp. MS1 TaxID=2764711 RepID=UPI001CC39E96|nr:hypothetical protein [Nostoc sp. MS1]BCL35591.1 hypothetical protein NSMS1_20380 [Nostoc sp. MS1]
MKRQLGWKWLVLAIALLLVSIIPVRIAIACSEQNTIAFKQTQIINYDTLRTCTERSRSITNLVLHPIP